VAIKTASTRIRRPRGRIVGKASISPGFQGREGRLSIGKGKEGHRGCPEGGRAKS